MKVESLQRRRGMVVLVLMAVVVGRVEVGGGTSRVAAPKKSILLSELPFVALLDRRNSFSRMLVAIRRRTGVLSQWT